MAADSKGNLAKVFTPFMITHRIILHHGKLWVPQTDIQLEVIRDKHDHPTSGHLGRINLNNKISCDFFLEEYMPASEEVSSGVPDLWLHQAFV